MTTDPVRDISWRGERLLPDPLRGDALRYTTLNPANVDAISIHHTTGPGLPPTAAVADEIAYLRTIDTYHRTSRGLDAIGYQMVAFASGRLYVTAPLDRYGAAVALQNDHTISIALPGDFTTTPPSPAHIHAAAHAITHVYAHLGRQVLARPHRYWRGTACPGDTWPNWSGSLGAQAIALHPTQEDDIGMTPEQETRLRTVEAQAHSHTTPPPSPPPPPPAQRTYTVRASDGADGLSGIALRQLGDAGRWPQIAKLNGLRSPYTIHAGQVLKLP